MPQDRSVIQRMFRPRPVNEARPLGTVVAYGLAFLVVLLAVVPFFYILSTSIKNTTVLFQYPPQWIPSHPYWGNYTRLLTQTLFPRWVLNTLIVAGSVTALKVVLDSMAGYAFAKLEFPAKGPLFILVIATLMIPLGAILLPLYFLVNSLGLTNTYFALILPPLANPLGIFLMRQFIQGLPKDLENAARLDGVSEFGIYTRIILPLVKPGLVVLAVQTFLLQYTSFLWPLVAATSDDMKLITTGLATQRGIMSVNYPAFSAGAVMALVPITIFFLFLQRYFIAGSLAGALKQ
ncbi:MAG: carbohydrate ABC transporter permease [Candidatus Dormibacteraceae bacterium]